LRSPSEKKKGVRRVCRTRRKASWLSGQKAAAGSWKRGKSKDKPTILMVRKKRGWKGIGEKEQVLPREAKRRFSRSHPWGIRDQESL